MGVVMLPEGKFWYDLGGMSQVNYHRNRTANNKWGKLNTVKIYCI